ncbi:hypothetical protein HRbin22_01727 [Candidatus Thermoflexus japonica]|uniref:Uncharacterized protein n=1 Tax=Candidatus Thermoflexus japonica TaxID=2035417 RepID=A0A2H5Y7R7_9CHLR|nr:hypothetical protein HRbin22_01727 [Candidatus Thermoflexus japonica]
MKRKNVVLNRPVFAQRAFDSRALTVLTALFHRFPEAGDYDLKIWQDERMIHRAHVRVSAEGTPAQLHLDLAALGEMAESYLLAAGGVIGFYVSRGIGRYRVEIAQLTRREKVVRLDNSQVIPEGDLFAVTLVRPGIYRVLQVEGRGEGEIHVRLPGKERYRPDQVTRVTVGKEGVMEPRVVEILAGQSVVFWCTIPASLRVEWVKAMEELEPPIQRPRLTRRQPRQPAQK